MLDSHKFEPIFEMMEKNFELVKKELLLDEWVRENTQIIFAQTNYPSGGSLPDTQTIYFYQKGKERSENYQITEACFTKSESDQDEGKPHGRDDSDRLIRMVDSWVKQKYKIDQKCIERACIMELEKHRVYIWCICLSVCFCENKGKRLLELTFRGWLDRLYRSGWYDCLEVKNQKDSSGPFELEKFEGQHKFVQEVLMEASQKIRRQIQALYAPVEIADIVNLSGEYYEKADCQCNLLFLPCGKENFLIENVLVFDFRELTKERRVLEWENIRLTRKLSQMAQKELCLLFTVGQKDENGTYELLGLCQWTEGKQKIKRKRLLKIKNEDKIPYLTVKIRKHMQFDIYCGATYILTCLNGNDRIRIGLTEKELVRECKEVFGVDREYQEVVKSLVKSQGQSHGTMIVILSEEDAKEEVRRLSDKQFGIKDPVPRKSQEHINKLNSIDGSVIMDYTGKIYGIGMILDGKGMTKGDIAKGARHNSANRYHEYLYEKQIHGMILIVSEDGATKILTSIPSSVD